MNCKPGDLAIVIKAPLSCDGNPIGMVVEVLDSWATDCKYGHCWLCKFSEPMLTLDGFIRDTVHVADDWLRPITGLPVDDELTIDMKELA